MKYLASLILAITLAVTASAGHGIAVRQQVVVQRQRVFVPRQRVVVQQFAVPQAFYAPQQFVQPIYSQQFNSGCNCQQLYR